MGWEQILRELIKRVFLVSDADLERILKEGKMPNALQIDMLSSGVVDTSGVPLAGGLVYTYAAGTTTDKATYTDAAMTTAEANPIVLDGAGCKNDYGYGNYKFVVKTAAGVTVRTLDNQYYMVPSTTAEVVNSISAADSPYPSSAVSQLIKVSTAGGAVTVALPTSVGAEGIAITVVKTTGDANAVTIDGNGSETINGAANFTISNQYEGAEVKSDNTNWFTVNANMTPAGGVTLTGTQTLTNKTLTAPTITGTITGDLVITGDNINRSVNDDLSIISGGNSASAGGRITMYGGAHASAPDRITYVGEHLFYDTAGNIVLTIDGNDVYTVDWTSYGGTSTISGWSSRSVTDLYYKVLGGIVFVQLYMTGTSNSTGTSFTLPYACTSTPYTGGLIAYGDGLDNGSSVTTPAKISMNGGNATVTVTPGQSGSWTGSGTKMVKGFFWYQK